MSLEYLQNFGKAFNLVELIQDVQTTYLHPSLSKLTRFNYLIPCFESLYSRFLVNILLLLFDYLILQEQNYKAKHWNA